MRQSRIDAQHQAFRLVIGNRIHGAFCVIRDCNYFKDTETIIVTHVILMNCCRRAYARVYRSSTITRLQ